MVSMHGVSEERLSSGLFIPCREMVGVAVSRKYTNTLCGC